MPMASAVRCTLPSSTSFSSTCMCLNLPRASRRLSNDDVVRAKVSQSLMDHGCF